MQHSTSTFLRFFRLILFLTCSLTIYDKAIAALITWDGGGVTNNWSEASNWDGDVLPNAADDVFLPPGNAVVLDMSATIRSLSVDNAEFEIGTISHLVISGSIGNSLECDSSNVTIAGRLSIELFGNKALVLGGTTVLTNNDSLFIKASQITAVEILVDATLNNSGYFEVDSADTGVRVLGELNNYGELFVTAAFYGGTIQAGIDIEDPGTVHNHPAASMAFSNPGAKSLGIANGGQLTNDGYIKMCDMKNGGISSDGLIENNDTIEISTLDSLFGSGSTAILNYGSGQINNNGEGIILLSNIGDDNERSVLNYAVFNNIGELHFLFGEVKQVIENDGIFGTAAFYNHGLINISDCMGAGILNGSTDVTFTNEVQAKIIMKNCSKGLLNFGPFTNNGKIDLDECGQAYFSSNSPSLLTNNDSIIISNSESGFTVGFGSTFVNESGGFVHCENVSLYGLSIIGNASLENKHGGEMWFLDMDFFQIEVQQGSVLDNQGIFCTLNSP